MDGSASTPTNSTSAVDPLRGRVDRLYAQESEERQERRGLEQRAATSLGAAIVALSLIFNLAGSRQEGLDGAAALLVVVGGVMGIVGLMSMTVALAGGPTNDEFSLRQALSRRADAEKARVTLEPRPLTDEYVAQRLSRVQRLTDRNARMVPLLRSGNLLLGAGTYFALAGFAVGLLL